MRRGREYPGAGSIQRTPSCGLQRGISSRGHGVAVAMGDLPLAALAADLRGPQGVRARLTVVEAEVCSSRAV